MGYEIGREGEGMNKSTLDLNNRKVGFVITGLLGMVEEDGLTPREAFALLDVIKQNTWHALMEIKLENKKA
jgi:hypothetical protein